MADDTGSISIHELVQAIRRNLNVDWTEPHRDAVYVEIRTSAKRVLRQRGVRTEVWSLSAGG